ncbi:hypothetical protein GH714_034069 [Hevea brasiliensis]|uniref:Uncharacterized protein n=1 Tax=Hevea brasiliensis TaxID=3981 RepID=A0A6A6M6H7_HEVBR|nr:hypothetical protein GH714_034069 [Hevea brasiliensis]
MALESFAFNVAQKVLEKLASKAYQEISIAWGVQGELKKLEDVLMTIKAVLLDAEEKQVSNNDVRVWLIKLKDVLYDAEDVLDEFECETQRKQLLKLYGSTAKKVGRFFSSSNPLAFSFKMGHKIKQIREQLDEIASHKAKFHLNERDETLQKPNDGGKIDVIPIVGIGGLGKTALSKLVYNDKRVQIIFNLRCGNNLNHHTHLKECPPSVISRLHFTSPWSFHLLQDFEHVRTALFMATKKISQSALDLCLSRLKYLRMLNLSESKLEVPLERIGSLKHLRLLFLPEIEKVPNSICKLQNLQSLLLRAEELPNDIRYLISLRFLIFSTKQKCLAKNGLGCLTSLRFLFIGGCENLEYLCEDMQGLKHLRTLIIFRCESLISLPQSMKYLTALETLHIEDSENLKLTMEEGKADQDLARFSLQRLILIKLPELVEFPEWLLRGSTNTLQFLKLRRCRNLKELPACLQNIASLQQLVIKGCNELSERCERGKGEDWSKIAHILKLFLTVLRSIQQTILQQVKIRDLQV